MSSQSIRFINRPVLSSITLSILFSALNLCFPALVQAMPEAGTEEASQEESRLLPSVVRNAIERSTAASQPARVITQPVKAVAQPVKAPSHSLKESKSEIAEHSESVKSGGSKSKHKFAGLADYYHHSLYGRRTASGQTLQKHLLTAAHRTLPFGTRVKVHNPRSGRSCVVVINDRGPFTKSKVIDLSHEAARQIGLLQAGTAPVVCTVVHPDADSDTEE